MKRGNYSECVYRLVKICEVKPNGPKSKSKHLRLSFWDAETISNEIKKKKKEYFQIINDYLKKKYDNAQLNEVNGSKSTKMEYREGPVVVFPEVEVNMNGDSYANRNCCTVCMGENRSKLWVRLSNNKIRGSEEVQRFYKQTHKVAGVIGEAAFDFYRGILQEQNFDAKEVYTINVVGVASIDKKVGNALKKLDDPIETMKEIFSESEDLFNSSHEVIFPYYELEKKLDDAKSYCLADLNGYDWLSVNDPFNKNISVFLSKDRGKGKNSKTCFVGLGYNPSTKDKPIMQKATRDILSFLSPNI